MLCSSALVAQQVEYGGYSCKDFTFRIYTLVFSSFQYLLLNYSAGDYMTQGTGNDLLVRLLGLWLISGCRVRIVH